MKKIKILLIIIIFAIIILMTPLPIKKNFSGEAEILLNNEKTGECSLSVEITELKSIIHCYRKSFSFILNGSEYNKFASCHYSKADYGWCLISQMYYDGEADRMSLCSLYYPPYFSHLELTVNETKYVLPIAVAYGEHRTES